MLSIARVSLPFVLALTIVQPAVGTDVAPLPQAHAHNDYEHARPLLDALDQGFTSVEADVFLVEGELYVAHNFQDLRAGRTLDALYLAPLAERVRRHGVSVYAEGAPFQLLIDLKSEAEATYRAVAEALAKYPDLFTRWTKDGRVAGPVTVVISGNRPIDTIAKELPRQAGVDGRLSDLEQPPSVAVMPLISDRWGAHFDWRGVGPFPETERAKLESIVSSVHDRGQKIRFWATADTPEMWRALRSANVDFINTDDLSGLAAFLRAPD